MDISLDKILFFDIETAPMVESYNQLSEEMQHLWAEKYARLQQFNPERYTDDIEQGWQQAGIYAEYARIVCISVGFCHIDKDDHQWHLRTKSFYGTDEYSILADFLELLGSFFKSPYNNLCGHNIKEFDIPFVCRRALINGLPLPDCLQIAGKKPWEVHFIDTMELWKFGDYKNYTSLKTLTAIFGIPTPKDDIDGSQVAEVYYKERNPQRISVYCQKDVVATAQVFLRLNGMPTIAEKNIQHTN
ncbi:MAG: 3'-5' exonuclease [Paludibacter sp.]|nr:3'-5' exonuclease [Bacteroidales bacterium]MCM1068748.1 3'-5' exonuclease [Prevotella sp.]MCM1354460.1 3'-5' exonuclease [Bacteroides sp.]MCM1443263.1 3'-5' exonuclease [Muribaculum sp.]MCM1481052.1 3'-5' exonuclease [Paludibacter sp.]